MCISLLGDGMFMVAMAWQVYAALERADGALAGRHRDGGADDRAAAVRRRRVRSLGPAQGDAGRGPHARAGGRRARLLSLTGLLELWHMVALVAVYGAGAAFFNPAFDAIVPDVLPADELAQANALDQFVRPLALRLAGPALGGVLVARRRIRARRSRSTRRRSRCPRSPWSRCDAARRGRSRRGGASSPTSATAGRFIRSRVWLWATFASRRGRLPAVHGPGRGAAAVHGQERAGRLGRRPRARVRRRRHRLAAVRGDDRPARPPAPRHHVHVRRPGRSGRCAWPATGSRTPSGS